MYLNPPAAGRCIVSIYTLENNPAGVATTGGISNCCICCCWQIWQVHKYQTMSALMCGHQKRCIIISCIEWNHLWWILSCTSHRTCSRQSLGSTSWWNPWECFRHSLSLSKTKPIANLINAVYSASLKPSGLPNILCHSLTISNLTSSFSSLSFLGILLYDNSPSNWFPQEIP